MRDEKRIEPFLEKFKTLWLANPDLRFGQLVTGVAMDIKGDMFYTEDNKYLEVIQKKIDLLELKEKIFSCNDCLYINMTEEEQNDPKLNLGKSVSHICIRHRKRVFHRCVDGDMLYPCVECNGNDFHKA